MHRVGLTPLLVVVVLLSACARDISDRDLAYLADGSLFVSRLDGSGQITLAHDVQRFRWSQDGSEIEFATRLFNADSTNVTVSRFSVHLAHIQNYVRDTDVTEADTLPTPTRRQLQPSEVEGFRFTLEGDTLVIQEGEQERRRVAGITQYQLHPSKR